MTLLDERKKDALDAARAALDKRGGVAALRAELDTFHNLYIRLDAEYPKLQEKHPNKWLAMGKDGVLSVGDSHDEAMAAVVDMELDVSEVIVEFISAEDSVLIL